MEAFVAGDIVVVPYPKTDFTEFKRRPAIVLTKQADDDIILCQITSRAQRDPFVISISDEDLAKGKLQLDSYARPNKISTVDTNIVEYKIGALKPSKTKEVLAAVKRLFDFG